MGEASSLAEFHQQVSEAVHQSAGGACTGLELYVLRIVLWANGRSITIRGWRRDSSAKGRGAELISPGAYVDRPPAALERTRLARPADAAVLPPSDPASGRPRKRRPPTKHPARHSHHSPLCPPAPPMRILLVLFPEILTPAHLITR